MTENRNLIIAIALSIAVLIGWQYLVAGPQLERARQQAAIAEAQNPATVPAAPGEGAPKAAAPSGGAAGVTVESRDAALAATPRVPIETAELTGSINLVGGRIDDLRLDHYRETVDPNSPAIVLLSPAAGPNGYFAEFGWIGGAGGPPVPGPDTVWTLEAGTTLSTGNPVTLRYDNGAGLVFHRTIAIDEHYMFTVTERIENTGTAAATLTPYGRIARLGEPHVAGYYILHEGLLGVIGAEGLHETSYKTIKGDGEQRWTGANEGWLGITDKYWATALVPGKGPFDARFSHADAGQGLYQADYRAAPVTVAPGETGSSESRLFAGAKRVEIIDQYRHTLGIKDFNLMIDWGWFWFLTQPMFYAIDWLFRLFGNFGVAILLITVIVKGIFFPLANKSYKSMSAMKKVQPQMQELRERFADDKVKQQQELMALYKREKINPLAGCWPVLVQIPVFFSLYKVLFVTIEMRHAPFFGWIQDLSAPDPTTIFNLFGLIPWTPPHILMLGIWPLIMGVTMWLQMRLNPAPADPAQQMIFNWMPVIFTFMLASFPAGLVIYWAWNNTLSILQQYTIMRRQGVEVNFLGNITSSFKRKPKAGDGPAPPKPANDSKAPAKSKPALAKPAPAKPAPGKAKS
ncbi:membrane protein insertase YidC [Prosthecomicrobium pneumaticum]|uniref:Membrane protein insertase YidC n=1 Tax=Prosthecomicrobium pneumaticum TaxID=81895 RepID=A0A7W9FNE5_9HYPH|nr:membrane protein insertase YidC [Prosthecomicrobium pneumaticum]MBB5753855.1 YidC/Oxa1 family membrane protein insertase [Prosthecomicrobium pneumaticum]